MKRAIAIVEIFMMIRLMSEKAKMTLWADWSLREVKANWFASWRLEDSEYILVDHHGSHVHKPQMSRLVQ